jgi:hypothetical protein
LEALHDGPDGVTMPKEVKSSFAYGFSLWSPFAGQWKTVTNTSGGPFSGFMWINGAGDQFSNTPELVNGTQDRLQAPSASAIISDLDHFSIADRSYSVTPLEEEVESTLPREEQVAQVAQCIRAWLQNPLGTEGYSEGAVGKALRDMCAPGSVALYQEKL